MVHMYYYAFFYDPNKHDEFGMPIPFNSFIFFLDVKPSQGLTEVEIYAADDKTNVPKSIQSVAIKKIDPKQVADDVFDTLVSLPQNKGLKHRRFF